MRINMQDNYVVPFQSRPITTEALSKVYARIDNRLRQYGISKNCDVVIAFVIGRADIDDMQCMHFDSPFWVTYFSERGKRIDACFFININDCMSFFLSKVYNITREIISYDDWP